MNTGGFQPFQQAGTRVPGLSLAAMLRGQPFGLMNPIQRRRDGQVLARLLLTGRMPER